MAARSHLPALLLAIALLAGATFASCTIFAVAQTPCDRDGDCPLLQTCNVGFCVAAAEGEGDVGEGEGGEGEGGEGEGEGEGAPLLASCAAIHADNQALPSGPFTIDAGAGPVDVFCEMTIDGGGWTRAALFDQAASACPLPWVSGGGGCRRPGNVAQSSTSFAAPVPYAQILGSVQAVAFANLDAFGPTGSTVDANYVDGVSITTGSPRVHLFTLSASHRNTDNDCPCDGGPGVNGFVAGRFSCDRAENNPGAFDATSPLWDDTQRCLPPQVPNATARFFTSLPLAAAVTTPLEVRILSDQTQSDEDIAVTHVELYVR